MHFASVTAVNAFSVWVVSCFPRCAVATTRTDLTTATDMDHSRRQGSDGYVDASRRHASTKRQAAAAVTDFVLRRAKAFRGERGLQAPHRQAAHRLPQGPAVQEKALRRGLTASHQSTIAGGGVGASTTDAELPLPSVRLPMGTLHGAAVGMASFMASGGRERPATLKGSPVGWAQGTDTTATLKPFRVGEDGSSDAVSPVDRPEVPLTSTRRESRSNPAKEVRGGPLAASLTATLFPPAASTDALNGVATDGEKAGRVGRRTSIFGHP